MSLCKRVYVCIGMDAEYYKRYKVIIKYISALPTIQLRPQVVDSDIACDAMNA